MDLDSQIHKAAKLIKESSHTTVFTGAGISVESGIPPFRGENGLWNKYDPGFLDINYFYKYPLESWKLNKKIFYEFFGKAKPNPAHRIIARLEEQGFVKTVITQNIDGLHQEAGSRNVLEFHGTSRRLSCCDCSKKYDFHQEMLAVLPPKCECGGILKPDYIFFGEPIPEPAASLSFKEAELAELFLVIGTTGEIQPASMIPRIAKENDGQIIEINTKRSYYTAEITDIFLQGKATEILGRLIKQELLN